MGEDNFRTRVKKDLIKNKVIVEHGVSASGSNELLCDFSQGIASDGVAILKDGQPMEPAEIINCLNALAFLIEVKNHKDKHGKDDWYKAMQPLAWSKAKKYLNT